MSGPRLEAKRWDRSIEERLAREWRESNRYRFDPASGKDVFSIDTPPPYVNRPIHIGQAVTYVMMDMFARFHRMLGHEVLFPLGLDRNGLPIEISAEERFGVRMTETPREEFLAMCRQVLDECSTASVETFARMGISFSSWEFGEGPGDAYLTDSTGYRMLTQGTFLDLWERGLIYETERVNNYCPGCRTTVADAEVVYEDLPSIFCDVVFRVEGSGEELIIGTTRPELICACAMLIYNPADERYAHLEGRTAVTPLFEQRVPIRAHTMADMEKGTGLVMMCSFGDLSDIRFFREMGLEPKICIGSDGRMNENAGHLRGLLPKEARERVISQLQESGLLKGVREIRHRTPICERSGDEIEFIAMREYYLRQIHLKEKMVELAHTLRFHAEGSRQILLDWVDAVSIDWPISRRRYYATEIPLWYCTGCSTPYLPPKGRYYRPWCEPPPVERCPSCGGAGFRGEDRVFDTWFDSSISPLWVLMYDRDPQFFSEHAQCTLRPQGKDIVRTWLYYTLLKCYMLTGRCIFRDAWINYHVVDEQGNKMSKSKGNVVDPMDVLDRYGVEPFRLWCALEGDLARGDIRSSFERIEGAAKTITKIWNVARFISGIDEAERPSGLHPLDAWILDECTRLEAFARERYMEYDFHGPVKMIRTFLRETFASHYLELAKPRAYDRGEVFTREERASARYTLHRVLRSVLKMLAPIVPFLTYEIHRSLYGEDVHAARFPEGKERHEHPFTTEDIVALNGTVWKAKKENGMSLKDDIAELVIPSNLAPIREDIARLHHAKRVWLGEETRVRLHER